MRFKVYSLKAYSVESTHNCHKRLKNIGRCEKSKIIFKRSQFQMLFANISLLFWTRILIDKRVYIASKTDLEFANLEPLRF